MAQEDIYLKMANDSVEAVLADKEEEMVYDGVFARTDKKLWFKLLPKRSFDIIPKAFIDDWSNVKVLLTNEDIEVEILRFTKIPFKSIQDQQSQNVAGSLCRDRLSNLSKIN